MPPPLSDRLRALGLAHGDAVLVHSSLRAVGPVEGGAEAVVDSLLAVLGPDGLLIVPTFTYNTARFDPLTEPGQAGVLGEVVRRRPDAVRSAHPTHSVAAIGAGAHELCAGHEELAAADPGSPFDRLVERGGKVLLLGVGHVANTTVHLGEFRAGVRYVELQPSLAWPRVHEVTVDGRARSFEYGRFAGCSRAFGVVERGLRERSLIRDGRVGDAQAQLVPAAAVVEETIALLRRDEHALLCTDPSPEHRCARARAGVPDPTRKESHVQLGQQ
ncbi:MAG TPA: AAC(3) family N-acetyltransferase [Gaiellaceae bacterium]|nr:AAC(3) family N-acetyltransferase [Gaiellaceae bacterium]